VTGKGLLHVVFEEIIFFVFVLAETIKTVVVFIIFFVVFHGFIIFIFFFVATFAFTFFLAFLAAAFGFFFGCPSSYKLEQSAA